MTRTSLFIEFMGDSPATRLFDYLLTERELDFSISDLADNAGIGRATLYRLWNNLIKHDIIAFTRKVGKAKLYKLNQKNPKVMKLMEIDDMLVLEELRQKVKKQQRRAIPA